MKKVTYLVILFCSKLASAYNLPTITAPNLVYTAIDKTPITSTTTNNDYNGYTSTTTATTILKQQVQRELPMFNADVKGALINSKQFKVLDMPKSNSLWTGNSQTILDYLGTLNKSNLSKLNIALRTESPNANVNINNESASNQPKVESGTRNTIVNPLPDYILLGQISSITADADMEPLQDTNKITSQYNIDISVDYQVVGTKDNAIIAAFNAYGHANDVKILNVGDTVQQQNHNIPLLINQASKSLAENVVSQLTQQFGISSKTYQIESITNVKVY